MSEENKREEQAAGLPPEAEAAKPADEAVEKQAPAAQNAQESPAADQPAVTQEKQEKQEPEKQAEAAAPAAAEAVAKDAEPPAKPADADAGASSAQSGEAAPPRRKETDEEKAARRKAAFEARQAAKAAAAQAKAAAERAGAADASAEGASAKAADGEEAPPPPPPSPNQPLLDRVVALLREHVGPDAVEEAYINEPNDHMPTIVMKDEHWAKAAPLFRDHADLGCAYLRNVSGVDYETYMEVVYYPLNMQRRETYCIKVRTNREQPSIPSATPVWETANWHEREIFDLLGIDFPGHPNMTRIMMPDDWVGHPLRKDYVPLDPEV